MSAPTISDLPAAPSRSDPATFSDRADAFVAALATFKTELNAYADYMDNLAILADGGLYSVQTSTTDTTPGRLLQVGAFGWGLSDATMTPTDDLDAWVVNGLVRYTSDTTGIPAGSAAGVVLHMTRIGGEGAGRAIQTAYAHTGEVFTRIRAASGWGAWKAVVLAGSAPALSSIVMNGSSIGGEKITIADDAVAVLTPPPGRKGFWVLISGEGGGNYPQAAETGRFWVDIGLSPAVVTHEVGSKIAAVTTDVVGTSGADGKVTLSVQAGALKLENRTGSTSQHFITYL